MEAEKDAEKRKMNMEGDAKTGGDF